MSDADPEGQGPRSLAEKLQFLRELKTPAGEKPPSYDAIAREISAAGVEISGPYVYNLVKGKAANPRIDHLEGIAAYFGVPTAYLIDEEAAAEIGPQLQLLAALKTSGLREIMLAAKDLSPASLRAVMTMVEQLRVLEGLGTQQSG